MANWVRVDQSPRNLLSLQNMIYQAVDQFISALSFKLETAQSVYFKVGLDNNINQKCFIAKTG